MSAAKKRPSPQKETVVEKPTAPSVEGASVRPALRLLRRPVAFVPLLIVVGSVAGYSIGALRLAAHDKSWREAQAVLERQTAGLQESLRAAQSKESSYRILLSISRVVVDLYDRNFGLAAGELDDLRAAVENTPAAAGGDLTVRIAALQGDLEELSKLVEEASRSAREKMRGVEHDITELLLPEGP